LLGDDEATESEGIERVKSTSTSTVSPSSSSQHLSIQETARLSLEFCLLWFSANYLVSACLEYTTVASSTILTSTSSVFTLLFGALFRVEKFSVRKLIAVLASLAGIALISSIDLSGRDNDADHRGDFPEKTTWELAVGDGLAFLSAVMYGIYAVFMKARIGDESRVDMPLFFGLVGLINVLLLWPGFFILHFTGIESFELPPGGRVTAIIFANSLSSLVSDIAWAYAVLLTSPIVVTVGLSMTIPLSLVGQIVLNGQRASALYWVGAVAVVASFVFVSEEEKGEAEDKEGNEAVVVMDEESLARHGGRGRG
jgi:solute carrier family 35 protein F5